MIQNTIFGLWLLVFGSIIATGMNIKPKTKDHSLKTATVFGLSPPKSLSDAGGGLCGLKENYQVSAFIEKFDDTQYSLWSLAVSLWFIGLECYEHLTND